MTEAFVSLDLGGTKIACALADRDLNLLSEESVPTASHEGPDAVLGRMAELVQEQLEKKQAQAVGIGIGVPGLVDLEKGHTRFLPNLPTQWRDVAVVPFLKEAFNCPVRILNDARTATLGELHFGIGKQGVQTFAYFGLGTGIGGGVVIDGELRLGALGAAGELGHQTVLQNGPLCGCGNQGCLEAVASGSAIAGRGVALMLSGRAPRLREKVNADLNRVNASTMAEAAREGDKAVADELKEIAGYVGIAVSNVICVLHPEAIVLGGGASYLGEEFFEEVSGVVKRRVGMFPPDDVRIEPSTLGGDAGMWGGLALAQQAADK